MEPLFIFLLLLAAIYVLARKARSVGREAGIPAVVITFALGAAVK